MFFLLGTLFVFAPLVRGGNRQVALSALLALGLALLAVLLAHASYRLLPSGHTEPSAQASGYPLWWKASLWLVASSPLWVALLQLLPMPATLWAELAGREPYLQAWALTGAAWPNALPLSLTPLATWAGMWSALPVAGAFIAALYVTHRSTDKLLSLLLFCGGIQVVLSLLQLAQGPHSFFYFGSSSGGLVGSFNNRNHLADFLAMLVPVWFYVLVRQRRQQHHHSILPRALLFPLSLFLGFSFLVILLSTQSRGGLIATALVLLLSTLFYLYSLRSKLKPRQQLGLAALFALFAVSALISVGLDDLSVRFEGAKFQTDADYRNALALSTLQAAQTFWPWGSGIGSFDAVFPRFQNLHSLGHSYHAHNDYAQLLMELGALAPVLVVAFLALVGYQLRQLLAVYRREQRWTSALLQRVFCGLGGLALLLHSWVEFNMHIPALALTAAFLFGVFLRPLSAAADAPDH